MVNKDFLSDTQQQKIKKIFEEYDLKDADQSRILKRLIFLEQNKGENDANK